MAKLKQFPRYLSVEVLTKAGACQIKIDHFREVFGDKPVKVTLAYLIKASSHGFPVYWRVNNSGWFTKKEKAALYKDIRDVPFTPHWQEKVIWKHIKLSWKKGKKK